MSKQKDFNIGEWYAYPTDIQNESGNYADGWRVVHSETNAILGDKPTEEQARQLILDELGNPTLSFADFRSNVQAHLGHFAECGRYYTLFYIWPDGKFTTFQSDDTLALRKQIENAGITMS